MGGRILDRFSVTPTSDAGIVAHSVRLATYMVQRVSSQSISSISVVCVVVFLLMHSHTATYLPESVITMYVFYCS